MDIANQDRSQLTTLQELGRPMAGSLWVVSKKNSTNEVLQFGMTTVEINLKAKNTI